MYEIVCLCGQVVMLAIEGAEEAFWGKCTCGRQWQLRETSGRDEFDEPEGAAGLVYNLAAMQDPSVFRF